MNRLLYFLSFLIICTLFSSVQVKAQFFFPSIETLKKQHVKSMKVYQKPIKFTGGTPKERENLHLDDTQKILYQVFYFNNFGYVDSTIYYPTESGFGRKVIYTYDGPNIVENKSISNTGKVTSRWLIQQTDNKEFIKWNWEDQKLRSRVRSNSDSIMIESLFFVESDTNWYKAIWYNPENDTRIEHWRSGNGAYTIETFQWFNSNSQPKLFMHKLEQKESTKTKIIHKKKTYDLDSDGNVINAYMGRFDDPYLHYNFFERHEKLKPSTFNEQNRFRENDLFKEIEVSVPYTFSGINMVYLYELEYEFW